MESHGNWSTNAIGFCLLPSELIHHILLYLALPEIMSLKSLSKSLSDLICDPHFVRLYNSRSRSATWLFVYKKRWRRHAMLHGFTDQSNRWFNIQIANLMEPMVRPGDDIYFLTASGQFFLFVSNTSKQVFAVNLFAKAVKEIPPSPLGPRGTSSWRRSGMKLVSGTDHFRFLFAELVDNHPVLFVYKSETEKWESARGREDACESARVKKGEGEYVFLNVANSPHESVVMAVGPEFEGPVILRPRNEFSRNLPLGKEISRLHVYGGEYLLVVKGTSGDEGRSIELWGLGANRKGWECISKVPRGIMEQMKKPYGTMMGCLEGRAGVVRGALLSNFEGSCDVIWISYDVERSLWAWLPLPDSKMKGLNMAGIAFSSGLTLS